MQALAVATEEARLAFGCTAGILRRGDKALVEQVSDTLVLSCELLYAMDAEGSDADLICIRITLLSSLAF